MNRNSRIALGVGLMVVAVGLLVPGFIEHYTSDANGAGVEWTLPGCALIVLSLWVLNPLGL